MRSEPARPPARWARSRGGIAALILFLPPSLALTADGYLELEGVVPAADLGRMLRAARSWHAAAPADFRGGPAPFAGVPAPCEFWRHEEGHPQFVSNVQYGGGAFARLAVNPEIMRVVAALQGGPGRSTLVASDMVQMRREGGALNEAPFHGEIGEQVGPGGSTSPGQQFKDYHVAGGEIFVGFLNCAVSLVDVPPGSGFVCIPVRSGSGAASS
eukprot:SAG22_NODE_813_length_7051_cov_71.816887_3_plen_214_part_00